MGFAYGDSGLEVAETAHGYMLTQHAVDLIPYPVPTHDVPNQLLERLAVHYQLVP